MAQRANIFGSIFCICVALSLSDKIRMICDTGWSFSPTRGTCVKVFRDEKTWEGARQSCEDHNSGLPTILDDEANRVLYTLGQSHLDFEALYIGLRYLNGKLHWLDEKSTLTFTKLDGSSTPTDKTCALLNLTTGYWDWVDCGTAQYYGCEKVAACISGWYGERCLHKCSRYCATTEKTCDFKDGTCAQGCGDGYTGPKCDTACDIGRYGETCSQHCSPNCAGTMKACNNVDGACTHGCMDGYTRRMCDTACHNSTFGKNCLQQCSPYCAGQEKHCNHITGGCSDGCIRGFQPPDCTERLFPEPISEMQTRSAVLVFVTAGILLVALIIWLFFVVQNFHGRRREPREDRKHRQAIARQKILEMVKESDKKKDTFEYRLTILQKSGSSLPMEGLHSAAPYDYSNHV